MEAPKLARDTVEVEFAKITAKSAARAITDFRRRKGDMRVISDCAAAIPQTITHKMARGTDDLEDQDIAHTMLHMNPAEHEKCEVWNAWAHLDCACRLRHIDDFNQACGRNLGFRQTGSKKHHLLISRELCRKIFGLLCDHSRYDLRLHIDRNSTYELKRKVAQCKKCPILRHNLNNGGFEPTKTREVSFCYRYLLGKRHYAGF